MVKLVHGDKPVVELLNAIFIDGKAERRVRADQYLVAALKKGSNGFDLSAVVIARRITEVPFWLHAPVFPKAELGQRLVVEACADCFFRHDDDRLLEPLILELVERDEHERATLARRGRRFDKQVLFA